MSFVRPMLTSTSPFALQIPDGGGDAAPAPASPAAAPAPDPAPVAPVAPAASPPPAAASGPAAPATLAGGATAPPPAAAPAAPATLAGGAPPADTRVEVVTRFPETWRDDLAAGDATFRKTLDRFDSPAALAKSYRELATKLSSGEIKAAPTPPPENATPEQLGAWRKEQGIPENPEGYLTSLQLPAGVVPGEADKPLLASFAEQALAANWKPEQYNQAISWYYGLQEQLVGQRQAADADFHLEATVELQREWGHEFKPNLNQVTGFLDAHFPEAFKNALLNARAPDGSLIGNDPNFNKAILEVAKIVNPVGAALPNVPGATVATAEARISEIETKYMRAPQNTAEWKNYWQGDAGAAMQAEYRSLLDARAAMRARQTAA